MSINLNINMNLNKYITTAYNMRSEFLTYIEHIIAHVSYLKIGLQNGFHNMSQIKSPIKKKIDVKNNDCHVCLD